MKTKESMLITNTFRVYVCVRACDFCRREVERRAKDPAPLPPSFPPSIAGAQGCSGDPDELTYTTAAAHHTSVYRNRRTSSLILSLSSFFLSLSQGSSPYCYCASLFCWYGFSLFVLQFFHFPMLTFHYVFLFLSSLQNLILSPPSPSFPLPLPLPPRLKVP